MLKDNLKTLRKNKGISQEELSVKLNIVRQTVSKWEQGLSVPDAEMLISISKVFDVPVSVILGDNIEEKENTDLKIISEKLEIINEQLIKEHEVKQKKSRNILLIIDICIILLFILLGLLGSPYLSWDYNNTEWTIVGTIWHCFEYIFFRIAPIAIIIITTILYILFFKKNK